MQMYYLVNGYRFITQKKHLKNHERDVKHLKKQILTVALQNYEKSVSQDFIKPFLIILSRIFLQHFSNKPYPNVKIILGYFYIIKTIQNLPPLRVLDFFVTLLRD